MEKKGLIATIVILGVCLLCACGYIVYDKINNNATQDNSFETNTTATNDDKLENNNEIKKINSYLIYAFNTNITNNSGKNIKVQDMTFEMHTGKSIVVDGKTIYAHADYVTIETVYLIDDILLVEIPGNVLIMDLNGNILKNLSDNIYDEDLLLVNELIVDNDKIIIRSSINNSDYCSENYTDNKVITAIYELDYLGNKKFSNISKISSKTYSDYCK